jgi:catechol 2,3-dioxygenase-like lactoylglutathione lyase family enzyme
MRTLLSVAFALTALAQLPAPNASGVSTGHLHMMVRDPDLHKKIWTEALGAQVATSGALELVKLPGMFLVFGKAEPAEGSEGSSVDHFAFRVKDLAATKAKLTAANVQIVRENAQPKELVTLFPDKVKVEFYEDPSLAVPISHFHLHFFTADPDALRAWYGKVFGAATEPRGKGTATSLPGTEFSFRKTEGPQAATKGRSLDHIGFEVKNLEAFCKKLEAEGIAFESGFRDVPRVGLKIAFLVDPAGTRIELTEGLAGR